MNLHLFTLATGLSLVLILSTPADARKQKLTREQKLEIIRSLTAEYATAKVQLPRAKKPLVINPDGSYVEEDWEEVRWEHGLAANQGDLVQITKVEIEDEKIEIELNGGYSGGRKWYERIQVGTGPTMRPIAVSTPVAVAGTKLAIVFPDRVPPDITANKIRDILESVLDFQRRSATEQYIDSLPPEIRKAIEEQRAIEGMDRDQVLLALGKPKRKVRETRDGEWYEDWIYGEPPGKLTFVTFKGDKVIQVREVYAGLGSVKEDLPVYPQ